MAKREQPEKMWQRKSIRVRFEDEDMDFYFLLPLGFAPEGGSTVGECFYVAFRIKEGDPASWATEWRSYADILAERAAGFEKAGKSVSAGETLLRACSYYRAATLGERPSQPESKETHRKMREVFQRATKLLGRNVERVSFEWNNTTVEGYLMHGAGEGARPTVITTHGGEMVAEELYYWVGAAGTRRGFNVLSLDAPGGTPYRQAYEDADVRDWYERGMTSMIDYAFSRKEVDPERLAVCGFSGGAYIGMKLTSMDTRIKAVIASAPIYDLGKLADAEFPPALKKAPAFLGNMLMKVAMSTSASTKVALERILWAAGVSKLSELLEHVYEHLPNPKKAKRIFTVEEGGDAHCQKNNFPLLQETAFGWLEDIWR
jgi:pimeloyl-ACP methyl ester carboxylesterase